MIDLLESLVLFPMKSASTEARLDDIRSRKHLCPCYFKLAFINSHSCTKVQLLLMAREREEVEDSGISWFTGGMEGRPFSANRV